MTDITWTTTRYTDHRADRRDCLAIQLSWDEVTRILGREHQGSADDDEQIISSLLHAQVPSWVAWAPGWADEEGWGLYCPMMYDSYSVIEDNGGGLHLAIIEDTPDGERCVYFGSGYEHKIGCLHTYLQLLTTGANVRTQWLQTGDPQERYDSISSWEYGSDIVEDESRTYHDRMGKAAMLEYQTTRRVYV